MASYPGVYLEQILNGVRPIEGVPTSTTAFVGRALRGPIVVIEIVQTARRLET
jgi:phage tail sheath protein FI